MSKEIDWKFILSTIANEKCILLIGPELCIAKTGKQYDQALIEHLNIEDNDDIDSYYERDGLFLFKDGIAKTQNYYKIKDFYDQGFDDRVHNKISEIPFHLIISTSPDHNLHETFVKNNILSKQPEFYDKTSNPEDVKKPSKDDPLIYNLFGSIDKEESMILTHDDLFDYLLVLLGSRNLPENVKIALKEAHNFIFLGFKFDKWYVQLLLRLLNLHNKRYNFARYASNKEIKPETQSMIIEQFKIEFVDDQIEKFVGQLYDKCKEVNMLRDLESNDVSAYESVNNYIEEDNLDAAFERLKDHLEKKNDDESMAELITLKGRFRRHQKKVREGILSDSEATTGRNKIRVALKELNDDIKQLE